MKLQEMVQEMEHPIMRHTLLVQSFSRQSEKRGGKLHKTGP